MKYLGWVIKSSVTIYRMDSSGQNIEEIFLSGKNILELGWKKYLERVKYIACLGGQNILVGFMWSKYQEYVRV